MSGAPATTLFIYDHTFRSFTRTFDEKEFKQLLKALQRVPIESVRIWFLSFELHETDKQTRERFRQLCMMLGSIPTLKQANLAFYSVGGDWALGCALESIRQVSELMLGGAQDVLERQDGIHFQAISVALGSHPCVTTLSLNVHVFKDVLTVLKKVPMLRKVRLWQKVTLDLSCARAIASLLEDGRLERVGLTLFDVSLEEPYQVLCEAISKTAVKSLTVEHWTGMDGVVLANALSQANLETLRISKMDFSKHLQSFCYTLKLGLATMNRLEEFDFDFDLAFYANADSLLSLSTVVRAAARCSSIKRLRIAAPAFTKTVEDSVVECIQNIPLLEEITATFNDYDSNRQSVEMKDYKGFAKNPPVLVSAMRSNYSIRKCWFHRVSVSQSLLTQCVNAICHLNSVGRNYIRTDSNDAIKATEVLACVKDDLDCLFFHVRENPALVHSLSRAAALYQPPIQAGYLNWNLEVRLQ
jgi:hypothetical protein